MGLSQAARAGQPEARTLTDMKSNVAALLLIGALSFAGCKTVVPLAIVDLQADKVIVQAGDDEAPAVVEEKAREGCALHGRVPLYLSERQSCGSTVCFTGASYIVGNQVLGGNTFCGPSDCVMHHLFACVR